MLSAPNRGCPVDDNLTLDDAVNASINRVLRGFTAIFVEKFEIILDDGVFQKLHQANHAVVIERDVSVVPLSQREILWPSSV